MTRLRKLCLIILILIVCTGCDRVSKNLAQKMLASTAPVSMLNDTIRIAYSENPGAMLSLGAKLPGEVRFVFFVLFVGVMLTLTVVYAVKKNGISSNQLIGLALITSGGLGNFLDRLFNRGAAIDFMNIGIGPIRTGIFNVADLLIVAGISLFILSSISDKKQAIPT